MDNHKYNEQRCKIILQQQHLCNGSLGTIIIGNADCIQILLRCN